MGPSIHRNPPTPIHINIVVPPAPVPARTGHAPPREESKAPQARSGHADALGGIGRPSAAQAVFQAPAGGHTAAPTVQSLVAMAAALRALREELAGAQGPAHAHGAQAADPVSELKARLYALMTGVPLAEARDCIRNQNLVRAAGQLPPALAQLLLRAVSPGAGQRVGPAAMKALAHAIGRLATALEQEADRLATPPQPRSAVLRALNAIDARRPRAAAQAA